MKPLFLAQIGRQLFGLTKECVAGVGTRNDSKVKPLEENGKKYLPLSHGNQAMICDLLPLMAMDEEASLRAKHSHYLILNHHQRFIALAMTGKGRLVMADAAAARPLPPAFTGISRTLIPNVLANCTDLILLVDMDALLSVPDWVRSVKNGGHRLQESFPIGGGEEGL